MINNRPIRKLIVAGLAGLVVLALGALGLDLTGTVAEALTRVLGPLADMQAEDAIAQALDLLIVLVAGWLTPDPRVIGSTHPDAPAAPRS